MSYTNKENYLTLFDPFFNAIFDSHTDASRGSFGNLAMKTDVVEHDGEYALYIDMPGIKKENINITYEDGYLTIEARKESKLEEKERYVSRERFAGTAKRSFYVENIDEESMTASLEDGVLKISFKEVKPEVKTKKIAIN